VPASFRPRLPGDRAFLAASCLSTAALTALRTFSVDEIVRWWIIAFEVVVLLRAIVPIRPWSPLRTHLAIALFFCLAGDILINWTSHGIYCVVFFAATHINLLRIFLALRQPKLAELPSLLPWCVASAVVFASVHANLPKPWMAPVLATYLLLLDLVAWRALALLRDPRPGGSLTISIGAILFFATDHLVVLQIFRPSTIWVATTWLCYPPALSLLAFSSRYLTVPGAASTSPGSPSP